MHGFVGITNADYESIIVKVDRRQTTRETARGGGGGIKKDKIKVSYAEVEG